MVAGVAVGPSGGGLETPDHTARTTGFVWLLSFSAVIGGFLFGYDTGVVSSAMIYVPDYLGLDYSEQQLVVSITIAFCALFSLVGWPVNEYLGRKVTILIASFLFTVGSLLLAASMNFGMLIVGRSIIGMAVGLSSMTVPSYCAECAPFHVRGTIVLCFQLMLTFGLFVASVLGGIYSLDPPFDPDWNWRLMFGTAAVPSIVQFVAFLFLPESPRWLVSHGKVDAARKVVNKMYAEEDKAWREYEMAEMLTQQEELQAEKELHGGGNVLWTMLRTPHVRRALLLGCAIQAFQQLGGINTLMYYTATIIRMSGFSDPQQAIWLSCGVSGVNFLFTLVPVFLVERMGRRPLLLISTAGVIVSCVILAGGFIAIANTAPALNGAEAINITQLHYEVYNTDMYDWLTDDEKDTLMDQATDCNKKSTCDDCVTPETCGFCFQNVPGLPDSRGTYGSCQPAMLGNNTQSWAGQCMYQSNFSVNTGDYGYSWQWDYCTSPLSPIVLVGMVIYLVAFSIGLGPMAWVINAEIYPNWARTTGNAIATFVNWAFNTLVAETFLMLTVAINKDGVFFMFAGITTVALVLFAIFVPETKGLQMEEVEKLFMSQSEADQLRRRMTSFSSRSSSVAANGKVHPAEIKKLNPAAKSDYGTVR